MASIRKRGASGYDDGDDGFMSDSSLSKTSKPMLMMKRNEDQQNIFQWVTVVLVAVVVFVLSFYGTMQGR